MAGYRPRRIDDAGPGDSGESPTGASAWVESKGAHDADNTQRQAATWQARGTPRRDLPAGLRSM